MPIPSLINLKPDYQNGEDNIGRDLIEPCLAACLRYRRGTGFFSASALNAYVGSLDKLIGNKTKIEIICSPKITSRETIEILNRNSTDTERRNTIESLRDEIVLLAVGYPFKVRTLLEAPPESEAQARREEFKYRCKLLSYFIATGAIELKIAIPRDFTSFEIREDKLYHVKNGYFVLPNDECVAFEGSVNESSDGHGNNIDSAQVFRSWVQEDAGRLKRTRERLDNDWSGTSKYIEVLDLSPKALDIIRKNSPVERPKKKCGPSDVDTEIRPTTKLNEIALSSWLWPHQKVAVERFLDARSGILEMATGTGKTKTSLEILKQLYLAQKISSVLIVTYGTDLLNQWYQEVLGWMSTEKRLLEAPMSVRRSYDGHNEHIAFCLNPQNSILIISRAPVSLSNLVLVLKNQNLVHAKTLVIHDEIHGMATKESVKQLDGLHASMGYRLGLSATPEREYDEAGTAFTATEIGNVIYTYDLEMAIKDRVLCPFDYYPLDFSYTEEDARNRQGVFKRKAAAEQSGTPWTKERTYIELSKVNKKASMKPSVLREFLIAHSSLIKSSIFFALDKEQGDEVCEVIKDFTYNYRTYYSGAEAQYLKALSEGSIDTLVACERLNEGVDIRSLNCVFLVSSDRARLTTIQRIGRCLRKNPSDPDKRANVVDFIPNNTEKSEEDDSDMQRRNWLAHLSSL